MVRASEQRVGAGWRSRKLAALLGAGTLALAAMSSALALADDAAPAGSRGVRLSSVTGQVQISAGGQVIAEQAVENAPLFEGTRVATGEDGRAEVQFEDGSVARLSPDSAFTIDVLRGTGAGGDAEVALESGLGYFELQANGQAGTIRVKFGDSTVTSAGFAVFRINMDNAPGQLGVFSGSVHLLNAATGAMDVHGGQSLSLSGKDGQFALTDAIEPDSWDSWNADRDQELNAIASAQTGASGGQPDSANPAWSDLDANGNWYNVPGQGQIWSPYEASDPGWGPYGNGQWMWTPRFGYMWVSGDAWGYTPYSCGMWNWYDAFGWGWSPGASGCSPWWNAGAFGVNVAGGPGWWSAPIRPREPPRRMPGPIHGRPMPAFLVNRRFSAPPNLSLPAREPAAPVVIAGSTVEPLRALAARPEYVRTADGAGALSTNVRGSRPIAEFGVPGSRERTISYAGTYSRAGAAGRAATGQTSAYRPSGASSAVRSTASASRSASSGGHSSASAGGGGAGHVSSGGGGTSSGGGGTHK